MKTDVFVPTKKEHAEITEQKMEAVVMRLFPKLIRKANRKEWLTTAQFEELFGVSPRLQKYYRDEKDLPYYQEKRKIVYNTDEVESWFADRKVNGTKK